MRPAAIFSLISSLLASSSLAVAATPMGQSGEHLTVYASGPAARVARTLSRETPPAAHKAYQRFIDLTGQTWRASFDAETTVPARIYGGKIEVPGSIAKPELAERAARETLARFVDLLAPGSSAKDFLLVTNDLTDGLRTVAFVQQHQGLDVEGGQVSFRFKNDRLFMIGSEAWPNVAVPAAARVVERAVAERRAERWIAEIGGREGRAESFRGPFILPILQPGRAPSARAVVEVKVRTKNPIALWAVQLDAESGEPVARRQTLMFATGTVQMNTPVRRPGAVRVDGPAVGANASVDGQNLTVDGSGAIVWPTDAAASVVLRAEGPLVRVINATGANASVAFSLEPDATFVWNGGQDERLDAQITSFIASQTVKAFSKQYIAPNLTWLDSSQLPVTVNMDDVCNAFSDGDTTNFFLSGQGCENTGRIPDVVYHEFGHALHYHSILPGTGRFETAFSEGASDFLAASITGDPQMGRGFFFDDEPLRDVDPADSESVWPRDIARDPHDTGLIFAGAMWDLRKALTESLGERDGLVAIYRYFYGTMQRAADIPTSYVEVLAIDDDDGDLSNGTPNVCMINEAFSKHGLTDPMLAGPGLTLPTFSGREVRVGATARDTCPSSAVTNAVVDWEVRGEAGSGGRVDLLPVDGGFAVSLPIERVGIVVRFKVTITLASGIQVVYPTNAADPMYEGYIGEVVPIYCTSFETDPLTDGWSHQAMGASATVPGADDWEAGTPGNVALSGDPVAAHTGMFVFGNDLGLGENDGRYEPSTQNQATTPRVDTTGFSEVRLQYWRWLNVEDGVGDQARITANGNTLWTNFASVAGSPTRRNHVDSEWRFHDVDLSDQIQDHGVSVSFDLTTNRRRRLGGWTLDDVCIVGVPAQCGNGRVEEGETCDDANATAGDGCERDCTPTPVAPVCGNGMVETGEACDDGVLDGTACAAGCTLPPTGPSELPETLKDEGCGCRTTDTRADGSAGLIGLALGAIVLRRRRR